MGIIDKLNEGKCSKDTAMLAADEIFSLRTKVSSLRTRLQQSEARVKELEKGIQGYAQNALATHVENDDE